MMNREIRSRTVGTKVTTAEHEGLAAIAESEGRSLGEWCRDLLLDRLAGYKPNEVELTLLAEVLALRSIVLNVCYQMAHGDKLTVEEMQRLIDRADADKARKAGDCFAAGAGARSGI